jgi:hypothetical protein
MFLANPSEGFFSRVLSVLMSVMFSGSIDWN